MALRKEYLSSHCIDIITARKKLKLASINGKLNCDSSDSNTPTIPLPIGFEFNLLVILKKYTH